MQSNKGKEALQRFQSGYNCCQSVICSFCKETGMKEEDLFKLTEGFGSGMGGLKDTCGAVTGMFLAISYLNSAGKLDEPKLTKMDTYSKFLEAAEQFREKFGSLYCRDLLVDKGEHPLPCCLKYVEYAADLVNKF